MKRILVIEDDDKYRYFLKEALTNAGYEVTTTSDGKNSIELHKQKSYDLVITDIFMPEKEGFEIILEFKSHALDVKIIAISGGGIFGDGNPDTVLNMAKDMGADLILSKPIRLPELLGAVEELLTVDGS